MHPAKRTSTRHRGIRNNSFFILFNFALDSINVCISSRINDYSSGIEIFREKWAIQAKDI